MKRFELRTGGFSLIIMLLVIIAVLSVNIACEAQLLDGLRCGNIVIIGGCIWKIAILSYSCYYILMNKVTVYDDHIKFHIPFVVLIELYGVIYFYQIFHLF